MPGGDAAEGSRTPAETRLRKLAVNGAQTVAEGKTPEEAYKA